MSFSKNDIRLREAIRNASQLLLMFMNACSFWQTAGCTPGLWLLMNWSYELRTLNINCKSFAIGYLFDYLCEWKMVCNTVIVML